MRPRRNQHHQHQQLLWLAAIITTAAAASAAARGPVSVPLAYKSTPAVGGHRQQHYLGIGTMHLDTSGLASGGGDVLASALDFVVVPAADGVGAEGVKAASAPVEKLEALNPQIWAYFASLEFQGNQVRHGMACASSVCLACLLAGLLASACVYVRGMHSNGPPDAR